MRIDRFFLAVLLTAIASTMGCTTVASDSAPGVDFSVYKTFMQAPPPSSAGANLPGYSVIAGEHIQIAIAHELEQKGFSPAQPGVAQLLVVFSVNGQPRQDIQNMGGGWGGWYGNTYTVNYTLGTLVIDIFDAKTKKLIWHAYSQTNLYGSSNHSNQVDGVVKSILKKFPPKPPKS
jgi:hypothetical protein